MFTLAPAEADLHARAATFFQALQATIISAFTELEPDGHTFTVSPWTRDLPADSLPDQGGMHGHGITALMRGQVFEKVGVNFSHVQGRFPPRHRHDVKGAEESDGLFHATGISLVAHMNNPFTPSVHMNVRHIVTSRGWFGGGMDLTPTFPFDDDTAHFHQTLATACEAVTPGSYAPYRDWCAEYFFLPHRGEERGVGGIFYDDLRSGDAEHDFTFTRAVGEAFLPAFLPLVERRMHTPFTEADKHQQNLKRGRYAEFNLLHDRGTRFGLQSGGNTEAILMSLPPTACW